MRGQYTCFVNAFKDRDSCMKQVYCPRISYPEQIPIMASRS
jgi:hypothetical protein